MHRDADPALAHRTAALARENAQLRRALDELTVLNDLAREIGGARDVEHVVNTIVRRALGAIHAEQGVVTLLGAAPDDPTETFVRTAVQSSAYEALRPEGTLLGWMLHHQQPLTLNTPHTDPRFAGTPWHPGVRSLLCVPLQSQGRLVGIVTLYNKQDANQQDAAAFAPEDQRLLTIIAGQSAQVIENARLYAEEQKLLRMQEEVHLAHRIQTRLLPAAAPALQSYDLAGASRPAQTVGGDLFDYLLLDDHRLLFWQGDVAGKGLPASLVMASVQAMLRAQAGAPEPDVAGLVGRTNELVCASTRPETFVTLFCACLDTRAHRLTYVNAGHPRPFLRRSGGLLETLGSGSLVLGVKADMRYETATCDLAPGDTLVIYSDGIDEAMNAARDPFGLDRLRDHLHASTSTAQARIAALFDAVDAHADDTPQSDDITLMVLMREHGSLERAPS